MRRFSEARDSNESEIVKALNRAGATVQKLSGGNGRPDLLVGSGGQMWLMEVKNLATKSKTTTTKSLKVADVDLGGEYHHLCARYGRERVRMLKRTQAAWFTRWQGPAPYIVTSPMEALAIIGVAT